MSVTFTAANAPRRQVPCPFCQEEWVDFPEGNGLGGKCDRFCTGQMTESEAPEVNLANSNAAAILDLLGFKVEGGGDLYGSCSAASMRQRIFRARNTDRSGLVREPEFIPGGHAGVQVTREENVLTVQRMGAAMFVCGNTDERTLERLAGLERLAIYAQEHNFEITWG